MKLPHITRFDRPGQMTWRVSVTHKGTRHERYFSDATYGGTATSLWHALTYRHNLLESLGKIVPSLPNPESLTPSTLPARIFPYNLYNKKTKQAPCKKNETHA